MATRKLKNAGRKKAAFGAEAAAILTAAGINAATQMAAAGINSSATKQAAKDQASAITASATKQAEAIKTQTERSKEYQQESQEFIKEQNTENRELQKDIQLQLQMLTGQQNVNDRLEASKIKVRNGGCTRRKLRNAGSAISSLRGSNLPFIVTDGGGVVPIGTTAEGFDLYELYGNDHKHYHKAQGGKHKTGVGIKFADGNVIEGEGNQNGNAGEKMLVTPTNAYFISRHNIKGFNPAKAVDAGMNPILAYTLQERIKAANGISDDGNNSSPVKKIMGGTDVYQMFNQSGPQPGVDTVGDTAVGVAAGYNNKRMLRNGGRIKALYGFPDWVWGTGWVNGNTPLGPTGPGNTKLYNDVNDSLNKTASIRPTNSASSSFGDWANRNADLIGAGIGAIGNLGGAWITSAGNRRASRTLANAYNSAAGILADAYNSLSTIDMNSLRREDFAAGHALAALQAPVSQAAQPLADVDRQLHRRLANAGKYSASGATAQNRMVQAEIDAQDMRNKIYAQDQAQMQQIRQSNAERVTQAAIENARLDTQANDRFTGAYLNLLQYNNDIENQKILGSAAALSEGAINGATAISQAQTANASAWAQAMTGSSQGFANSLSNMATRKADLEKVLLGANGDSQASYYANPRLSTINEARAEYNRLVTQYNAIRNSDKENAAILRRRINNIATGRGFDLV